MGIILGSARIDENGHASGGIVGDQKQNSNIHDTSGEVSMQPFYVHSKGWYVLRPKKSKDANRIACGMEISCNNKNLGYDQNNRLGVIKYGIETNEPTECDCSSLVRAVIYYATGIDVGNFTTSNEADILEKSGLFEKRFSYISNSSTPIYNGDVLVTKTKGHTVIVVSGNAREKNETKEQTNTENIKNDSNYYLENSRVGEWQNAMNIGFDTNELEVDNKFGTCSQNFASTHMLWSGQTHDCITAIRWLRRILRDRYGFTKLPYNGYWDSYLTLCVKTFQKNRNIEDDGKVGLITTYHLLEGTVM